MNTQQSMPKGSIDVSLGAGWENYSRDIFGHFIEHFHRQVYGGLFQPGSELSDERGFRLDVIDAMREMRPSVVRWPGGCFVSSYHWLDGVGKVRRPHYDKAWRVTDPNTFGTREFVEWCEAIDAAPYICTNAGTGTAEQMSDWVEYCNLPAGSGKWADLREEHGSEKPFNVRYWSIGNENYGNWEIGAKSAEEWARLVTESAKMIRHVDEKAVLLTAARADLDWMLPLLEGAGSYLDMLSIHGYWDTLSQVNNPSSYLTALSASLEPEQDIERTRQIIGAAGLEGRIRIAFDEWNLRGWHHPNGNDPEKIQARDLNDDNSTYTLADALFTAGFLNTCLRNADVVSMANMAPSINTRGPLFVHDGGVVRRSTFHVIALYADRLGGAVLPSTSTASTLSGADVPVLDHIATYDESAGTVTLALINRDPKEDLRCRLSFGGQAVSGRFAATLLTGDDVDSYNDVDIPDAVSPRDITVDAMDGHVTLPPHSLTILTVPTPFSHGAGRMSVLRPSGEWTLDRRSWRKTN
jgi:alpha-N-arabinofuranosidase